MKKLLFFICLLLCLSGCKSFNDDVVKKELDNIFDRTNEISKYRRNNIMDYYEYYLPSDMSEECLDSDSIVLKFNDSRIIMNLNISSIVNKTYYPSQQLKDDGFYNEEDLLYSRTGVIGEDEKKYVFNLYKYNDQYIVHLFTDEMNYYGTSSIADIVELSKHLLVMANNANVNIDEVMTNYSKKDVIDYHKKQINLFETALPVNGELSSMLVEDAVVGDGVIISERIEDDGQYIEEVDIYDPVGGQSFNEENEIAKENQQDITN